jgi:hypothetical protein
MKKAVLSFSLLFFMVVAAFAQTQLVFQERDPKTYLFQFNGGGPANGEINYIINRLAESYGRNNYKISYQLSLNQLLRITRSGKQLTLTVEHPDLLCTGDVFYKAFSVADELLPSTLEFQLNLLNSQNKLVTSYTFDNVKIVKGMAEAAQATYTDTTNGQFKLQVVNFKITYDRDAMQRFDDRIDAINDYNVALAQMDLSYQDLQAINLGDIDNIPLENTALKSVENSVAQIESGNIPQRINLAEFDPGAFAMKFASLKDQTFRKRVAMNQVLATLDVLFYNRGLEFLVNGNSKAARNYFERSAEVNPAFAPANYQLAKMDLMNGNIQDAEKRAKDVLYKMNPDANTGTLTTELLKNIVAEYISQGAEFNRKGMFSNALNLLQRAKGICNDFRGVGCDEKLFQELKTAKTGIYQQNLDDAKNWAAKNELDKAERSVNDALAFQSANSNEIPDHSAADAVMKGIKQQRYTLLVNEARTQIAQKDFNKALQNLNTASDLQAGYGLTPAADIVRLKKDAAKPVILAILQDGLEQARDNQLSAARKSAKGATSIQTANGLMDDKEIAKTMKLLTDKIFSQQCINAQGSFDDYVNKAKQAEAKLEFINADNFYVDAEKVLAQNAECALNTGVEKDDHIKILPAATYQKLLFQAIELQDTRQYQKAIDKYSEAGKYFIDFEIAAFKLEHRDLSDFALANGKNGFLAFIAEYYTEHKMPDKALAMYKELIKRNYSARNIKRPSYELGKELARRDFAKDPKADRKKLAAGYVQGIPELKFLERGFRSEWRKLK